ncbi:shikimate dehydrogenase [Sansalvadorimonas sp. 2012CJ34-2]|uniref:Shikimate dehydrogenase (NADP(+)) n=1 Tax=Parendozoicomonas callyspongiae TaxID=2942213 RepID=A0ABT0PB05_9GAMM|nr:shikimate dehydrogenase [Sansalvadorimonas sp. 2012CJ34-2]MCL6268529.1 shikimate dehydrogenase [Sansalvadorimonas sp. 2012CJ34-2]
MDQYAVMGNPISHSKSPQIHTAFAAQTKQQLEYKAIHVELDGFAQAVSEFFTEQNKGKGLNITVPFKQQAWELAGQLTERAKRAGAVNTLWKDDKDQLWGDTTDGVGLVRDITRNHKVTVQGKRVLVLGAGGAVRGVLQPLLEQNPAEIVIANRTVSKAEELVELFSDLGKVTASGFEQVTGMFDLVINGTAASLQGDLPPLPASVIKNTTVSYDMMYGKEQAVFNHWAQEHGASKTLDGLGMLVEQAAESFSIWRGILPETTELISSLS